MGQKPRSPPECAASGLARTADITEPSRHVRKVPGCDIAKDTQRKGGFQFDPMKVDSAALGDAIKLAANARHQYGSQIWGSQAPADPEQFPTGGSGCKSAPDIAARQDGNAEALFDRGSGHC